MNNKNIMLMCFMAGCAMAPGQETEQSWGEKIAEIASSVFPVQNLTKCCGVSTRPKTIAEPLPSADFATSNTGTPSFGPIIDKPFGGIKDLQKVQSIHDVMPSSSAYRISTLSVTSDSHSSEGCISSEEVEDYETKLRKVLTMQNALDAKLGTIERDLEQHILRAKDTKRDLGM